MYPKIFKLFNFFFPIFFFKFFLKISNIELLLKAFVTPLDVLRLLFSIELDYQ